MEQKFTVEETAQKLKVSNKTILREIQRGKLRTERVGRRHLISENVLNAYLNTGSVPVHQAQLQGSEHQHPEVFKFKPKSHLNLPPEHLFQEEDSDNCGPCCLAMVYKLKGFDITLENILKHLNLGPKGQPTYSSQLASHLLNNGLRTNLIVSAFQFLPPAWKNLSRKDLTDNLKNWLVLQPKHKWHIDGLHTLFYLQEGGSVEVRSFDSDYLKKLLDRGSLLILCVDEVGIWGHRFHERKNEIDDLRAKTWGHFVVATKYLGDKFTILDPYPTNLPGREGMYEVEGSDLVAATLTWSATILEVLE